MPAITGVLVAILQVQQELGLPYFRIDKKIEIDYHRRNALLQAAGTGSVSGIIN